MPSRHTSMDADFHDARPRDEGTDSLPLFSGDAPANKSAGSRAAAEAISEEEVRGQKRTILVDLLQRGPASRRQLIKRTGLEYSAITGRVRPLLDDGWLCEPDTTTGPRSEVALLDVTEKARSWWAREQAKGKAA
jgi:hypothetical protein